MKGVIGFISGIISLVFLAAPVFAADIPVDICPRGPFEALCKITGAKFGDIISNLIIIALVIAVVIGVFFLIYGGIRWILSGGDKTAVENARNTIVAAIVGLAIAFLSYFILSFVFRLFGLDITKLVIPPLVK